MCTADELSACDERKRRELITRTVAGSPTRTRPHDWKHAAAERMEPGRTRRAAGDIVVQLEEMGTRNSHSPAERSDEAPGGAGGDIRGAGAGTSRARSGTPAGAAESAGDV